MERTHHYDLHEERELMDCTDMDADEKEKCMKGYDTYCLVDLTGACIDDDSAQITNLMERCRGDTPKEKQYHPFSCIMWIVMVQLFKHYRGRSIPDYLTLYHGMQKIKLMDMEFIHILTEVDTRASGSKINNMDTV